jgi:hypothetical protein
VSNYQEIGENYDVAQGSWTTLMDDDHLYGSDLTALRAKTSYESFPPINILARWQFNYQARRLAFDDILMGHYSKEQVEAWNPVYHSLGKFIGLTIDYSNNSRFSPPPWPNLVPVDNSHVITLLGMLESWLPHESEIVHIDISPLTSIAAEVFKKNYLISCDEQLELNSLSITRYGCLDDIQLTTSPLNSAILLRCNSSDILAARRIRLPVVEYMFILGLCSSAPTSIDIAYDRDNDRLELFSETLNSSIIYSMVESSCLEGDVDYGLVVYRNGFTDPIVQHGERYHVMRRQANQIISTLAHFT